MGRGLLILLSDEHQARAMGCAGHPLVRTPALDALAARGLHFTAAYTPSPICVPARAALATGQYVHRTGHWDNATPYTGTPPGWGHTLQTAGVRVESIGKLHYRDAADPAGFDAEHIPMMVEGGVGMIWASIRAEDERWSPDVRMLGGTIGAGRSRYTDYDEAVVARATRWLEDRATRLGGGDWCLFVGLVAPHFPLLCPERFFSLYPPERLPQPKLHPRDGHARHPWVEKQNAYMDSEAAFADEAERKRALSAYFGLCSLLDHNVGLILAALEATGLSAETTVVYASDHGDNAGARGLWGKSNMYEESVAVPLMIAGPGIAPGTCDLPVSLVDLSATIPAIFGLPPLPSPGQDLRALAAVPPARRPVFSEYHAAGAVSAAYMIRLGPWKYIHYEGFAAELFDLSDDPEETRNRVEDPTAADALRACRAALYAICDPAATDARAHADQRALVARFGGPLAVRALGPRGATRPPETP
jgi:choline-sulfatase